MEVETAKLKLVSEVVGRTDIARLLRELAAVEDFLHQASIRQPGKTVKLPTTGRLLDQMTEFNGLNLLKSKDRQTLASFLQLVYKHAPQLHMSFTVDPPPLLTHKLIVWLRQNIHPQVMLQIGLHPSIGAGCVVRTNNKYFDLSLRQKFADNRDLLIDQLNAHTTSVGNSKQVAVK